MAVGSPAAFLTRRSPIAWSRCFTNREHGEQACVAGAESSKPRFSQHAGASKTQPRPHKPLLRDNGHAKADVVVTPFRLEALPERRAAGPTVVAPGSAAAHPGKATVPVSRPL